MAEVFAVEGAERGIQTQGGRGNQRVNQADALRQMQEAEVADGLKTFKVCRPDERKMFCELIYG